MNYHGVSHYKSGSRQHCFPRSAGQNDLMQVDVVPGRLDQLDSVQCFLVPIIM